MEEVQEEEIKMKKVILTSLLLGLIIVCCFNIGSVTADEIELCGNGSSPDYGFNHSLEQPHWTLDREGYLSPQTIDEVDYILDGLYFDNIVETVFLVLPSDQVGNSVNCAVHYLRYMKMGRSEGPRADNGLSFLFIVRPDGSLDVHYGVGLGLPEMTAPHLTDLNRVAEDTFAASGSYDQAVLALLYELDKYAREKYEPISDAEYDNLLGVTTPTEEGNYNKRLISRLLLTAFVCILILYLLALFSSGGSSSGGYSGRRSGSYSSGYSNSSSRSGSRSVSRGGRGSGRSGRGN